MENEKKEDSFIIEPSEEIILSIHRELGLKIEHHKKELMKNFILYYGTFGEDYYKKEGFESLTDFLTSFRDEE